GLRYRQSKVDAQPGGAADAALELDQAFVGHAVDRRDAEVDDLHRPSDCGRDQMIGHRVHHPVTAIREVIAPSDNTVPIRSNLVHQRSTGQLVTSAHLVHRDPLAEQLTQPPQVVEGYLQFDAAALLGVRQEAVAYLPLRRALRPAEGQPGAETLAELVARLAVQQCDVVLGRAEPPSLDAERNFAGFNRR